MSRVFLIALALAACDLEADVYSPMTIIVDDACDLLAPDGPAIATGLPLPRFEGEPCYPPSGEVCDDGLVCFCWTCMDVL